MVHAPGGPLAAEYRELRKRYGLFEIVEQPELCAEVTLQPVRRHDVDAAVMFADIMSPVLPMGIGVELVEGVGPVVREPISSAPRTSSGSEVTGPRGDFVRDARSRSHRASRAA